MCSRVRHLIGDFLLSPGITKATKEALTLLDDPVRRKIAMSNMSKCAQLHTFTLPQELDNIFGVQHNQIQIIDMKPTPYIDLIPANAFRHIGKHVVQWKSNHVHTGFGIPLFPPNVGFFRNLVVLNIANMTNIQNHEFVELPDLSDLSCMEVFSAHNAPIQGAFPPWIHHWKHLEIFDVSKTRLTGRIPASIQQCVELRTLSIEGTCVSEQLPFELTKCTKLRRLNTRTRKKDSTLTANECVKFVTQFPDMEDVGLRVQVNAIQSLNLTSQLFFLCNRLGYVHIPEWHG